MEVNYIVVVAMIVVWWEMENTPFPPYDLRFKRAFPCSFKAPSGFPPQKKFGLV